MNRLPAGRPAPHAKTGAGHSGHSLRRETLAAITRLIDVKRPSPPTVAARQSEEKKLDRALVALRELVGRNPTDRAAWTLGQKVFWRYGQLLAGRPTPRWERPNVREGVFNTDPTDFLNATPTARELREMSRYEKAVLEPLSLADRLSSQGTKKSLGQALNGYSTLLHVAVHNEWIWIQGARAAAQLKTIS